MWNIGNIFLCALYGAILCAIDFAYADDVKQILSDKEQSTANKVVTGVSTGVTGYGVSRYLQGQMEQSADEDAERDMRAYLLTFKCKYGADNMGVSGGDKNVELPGANVLMPLASEYAMLVTSLKARKEALGMAPGIEAQEIVSSSVTGLYDNMETVREAGAFASMYRALRDSDGDDAMRLAMQKQSAREKMESGGDMAISGVLTGVVGNALINSDILSRVVATNAESGDNRSDLLGLYGDSNVRGGRQNAVGGASVSGGTDGEIERASDACDALRADISVRAESLYDDILAVQVYAQSEEIDTTAIDSAVTNAEKSKEAIANAQSAADNALASAQKLALPDKEECELEFSDEEPMEEDYDDAEEQYLKDKRLYETKLQRAKEKQKKCSQDVEAKYERDLKKWRSDAKKYADEAVRQLSIGRTELGKIERALSNAQSAKMRGITAKEQAAAKQAAELKKAEDLQQKISAQAELAKQAVARASEYYDNARDIASQVEQEIVLDEQEMAAQDQINALKTGVDEDVEKAKSAMESAEKQVKTASNATTEKEAADAVREATRQESIARGRLKAVEAALQKIREAKNNARDKYLKDNQDSEETEENLEEEEE